MTQETAKPRRKKKAAKFYEPECKRCKQLSKPRGVAQVKKNIEGKLPISCPLCGSRAGYKWFPVTEDLDSLR